MRRLALTILTVGLAVTVAHAQDRRVMVTFVPQNKNPKFDAATDEYRRLWAAEGGRIILAMEQLSKLKFPHRDVKAEIFEGPSSSGVRFNREGAPVGGSDPMRLRASYQAEEKKGTLTSCAESPYSRWWLGPWARSVSCFGQVVAPHASCWCSSCSGSCRLSWPSPGPTSFRDVGPFLLERRFIA